MRSVCDKDFNWATRCSTPIHLSALSGRANEFRQDGPETSTWHTANIQFLELPWIQPISSTSSTPLASFSAKRTVRALATCRRTSSTLAICPRNQSSQATLSKMRANFSWMAVRDSVNLACSHNGGRAPRFSGMQKGVSVGLDIGRS